MKPEFKITIKIEEPANLELGDFQEEFVDAMNRVVLILESIGMKHLTFDANGMIWKGKKLTDDGESKK